jgi:hypothetical protein
MYCSNVGGYTCSSGSPAEYSMDTEVSFILGPKGLVVDAISHVSAGMNERFYGQVEAVADKARASRKPCR